VTMDSTFPGSVEQTFQMMSCRGLTGWGAPDLSRAP
jgi:hypothetical protein